MYKKIEKMIKDLELRGRSKDTIKNMVCAMNSFSRYYNQPPETLGEKQIIQYLQLIGERNISVLMFFHTVNFNQ